jgi:hypothetical protein
MKLSISLQNDRCADANNIFVTRRNSYNAVSPTITPTTFVSSETRGSTTAIIEANDNDVLCGKDKTYLHHPGNKLYREIIMEHASEYEMCKSARRNKMIMTTKIYGIMTSVHKCRFLRRSSLGTGWDVLTTAEARDKISHALRFTNKCSNKIVEKGMDRSKQMCDVRDNPQDTVSRQRRPFLNDNGDTYTDKDTFNSWMLASFPSDLNDIATLEASKRPPLTNHGEKESEKKLFSNTFLVYDFITKVPTTSSISNLKSNDDGTFTNNHDCLRNCNTTPDYPDFDKFHDEHNSSQISPSYNFHFVSPTAAKKSFKIGSRKCKKMKTNVEVFGDDHSFSLSDEEQFFQRIFQMGYNACMQQSSAFTQGRQMISAPMLVNSVKHDGLNFVSTLDASMLKEDTNLVSYAIDSLCQHDDDDATATSNGRCDLGDDIWSS